MSEHLKLRILGQDGFSHEAELSGTLELGRQREGEPGPGGFVPGIDQHPDRLIIAPMNETANVSRQHALLEPLPSGRVRVTNRSKAPLSCAAVHGGAIAAGVGVELAAPFSLLLPGRSITVASATPSEGSDLHSLSEHTLSPSRLGDVSARLRSLPALATSQLDDLVGWLQTTMGVLQASVGSADFLRRAAEALVEIVGLHTGRVMLLQGDVWAVAAAHGTGGEAAAWKPSQLPLERVRRDRKTYWHLPRQPDPGNTPSLVPLQSAVAAPILDAEGNVIGALYGERRKDGTSPPHANGKVEAVLVELLACGVATGLARQEQERSALKARVQFEQFFGSELTRYLEAEPDLLQGREAEVTVLFCDVRGFSAASERLGAAGTVRWIGDVMRELSRRVLDEEGVLVDYIGDEMLSMWGAPRPQPDQAARAVRAALAMLGALALIDGRWLKEVGEATRIGIGLNTGTAQVGNTGSEYKFKYGPLGNTVNLGSRVQGLTKYLKRPLLVTAATRRQLGDEFIARRVVKTRVVNIKEPVDLYEVERAEAEERRGFFQAATEALDALEAGSFAEAAHKGGLLLMNHHGDGPLQLILSRASTALVQDGRGFDAVWEPPGK